VSSSAYKVFNRALWGFTYLIDWFRLESNTKKHIITNTIREVKDMIKTKLAKKVLTKAEQRHLTKDANIHSMRTLRQQIDFMKKENPDNPSSTCQDCWWIATKLGIIEN